ncbi:MAG: polysaccharide lyase [Candidatus Dormibacteria bacterium]
MPRSHPGLLLLGVAVLPLIGVGCGGGSSPKPSPTSTPIIVPTNRPTPDASITPSGVSTLPTFFGADFNSSSRFCTFDDQVVAVAPNLLTAIYPAGSTAPSMGPPYGGAQICEPFSSGPRTSATLSYEVRFPVGFEFVKGGKLPGLYGGVEPFSGGGHNASGWSARLMWREGGAGEIYAYIAGVSGYGLDLGRGDFTWPADGHWHTVSLHVALNTPGQSNGEAVLSLDGRVVVDATGLEISTSGVPVGGLFFSTFYGGHDPSWAPSARMHIGFRDFTAS